METQVTNDLVALGDISEKLSALDDRLSFLKEMFEEEERDMDHRTVCLKRSLIRKKANKTIETTRSLGEKRRQQKCRLRFNQSFGSLPFDIRIHIMRHTRLNDIGYLTRSGMAAGEVFETHEKAVFRGMEVEQFSEFAWLFGDSTRRSPKQKETLKVCMASGYFPEKSIKLIEAFTMVDDDAFAGRTYIGVLQMLSDCINMMVDSHDVAGRKALCITMFSFRRVMRIEIQESTGQTGSKDSAGPRYQISREVIPMEERLELLKTQSVATQAAMRALLERGVLKIFECLNQFAKETDEDTFVPLMGEQTVDWIWWYLGPDKVDHQMKKQEMGPWMAKLAVGYILHSLFICYGQDWMTIATEMWKKSFCFWDALTLELMNSGSTDEIWREERDFAESIGFDWSCTLRGTAVGSFVHQFLQKE